MEIKILHLYYDIMNLYGEYGNIKLLEKHIKDQGFEVKIDKKTIDEDVELKEYDFIYIGAGTEKNQEFILEDMKRKYKDKIQKAIEDEKIILLTGNSYEVLGKSIDDKEALGIFNFETVRSTKRLNYDIIAKAPMLENKVIGFVNKMSCITKNENPLFEIEFGIGDNNESNKEGIIYKNLIGTHLIGPLLAKNPEILKLIVTKICSKKNKDFKYKEIEYKYEEEAYKLALKELESRKEK